jgi:hypothetical protein
MIATTTLILQESSFTPGIQTGSAWVQVPTIKGQSFRGIARSKLQDVTRKKNTIKKERVWHFQILTNSWSS